MPDSSEDMGIPCFIALCHVCMVSRCLHFDAFADGLERKSSLRVDLGLQLQAGTDIQTVLVYNDTHFFQIGQCCQMSLRIPASDPFCSSEYWMAR
jgi:hypothetical protein